MRHSALLTIALSASVFANGVAVSQPTSPQTVPRTDTQQDQIAFASQRDGNREIYVMNPDGSGIRRVTPMAGDNRFSFYPRWSPDRSRIAFMSDRDRPSDEIRPDDLEIYVIDADGTNLQRLTNNAVQDHGPAWSPDGTRIAFSSARDGNLSIYVMNADGSNVQRLTSTESFDREPDWSPDGQQIVFSSWRQGDYSAVYVMNADGSNPRRLSFHDEGTGAAAWSPDGSQIAYYLLAHDRYELYVINPDGSNGRRLAEHPGGRPRWSRTGDEIVFQLNHPEIPRRPGSGGGGWEIYVMNSDGTNVRRLTVNDVFDAYPDW